MVLNFKLCMLLKDLRMLSQVESANYLQYLSAKHDFYQLQADETFFPRNTLT